MRNVFAILLSLLALTALTACGEKNSETTPDPAAGGTVRVSSEAVKEMSETLDVPQDALDALIADGFAPSSSDGMTDYSVEELLAALESGAHSANSPLWDAAIDENGDIIEGDAGNGMVAAFSDAPWADKTVEVLDLTEGMSAEEKAEWKEFANSDWSELLDESENMVTEMVESLGGDAVGEGGEEDEDSSSDVSMDGSWPSNEFTKGLPAPDFQVTMTTADEYSFSAAFSGVTKAQAVAYAETLKRAGFSANAETTDQEVYGMTIYLYSADNAAGYHADLTFSDAGSTLTISK